MIPIMLLSLILLNYQSSDETAERQAESSRKFEQETLDSDQVTFYENSPTSSLDDYYDFCDVDDEIVLMMESGDTDNPRFKELVQIRDAYLD